MMRRKEGRGGSWFLKNMMIFARQNSKNQKKKKAFSNVNVQSPQEKSFFLIFLRIFIWLLNFQRGGKNVEPLWMDLKRRGIRNRNLRPSPTVSALLTHLLFLHVFLYLVSNNAATAATFRLASLSVDFINFPHLPSAFCIRFSAKVI